MKTKILLFLCLFLFVFSPQKAFAVEELERLNQIGEVYTPTMLPDSPWYFIKSIRDQLKIAFSFEPLKKAYLNIELANKKTLELQQLCEIGKCNFSKSISPNIVKLMETVSSSIENEKNSGKDTSELVSKYKVDIFKQLTVLKRLGKIAPPTDRDLLLKTKGELTQIGVNFSTKLEGQDEGKKFSDQINDLLNKEPIGVPAP
jgi:hypothetical protein